MLSWTAVSVSGWLSTRSKRHVDARVQAFMQRGSHPTASLQEQLTPNLKKWGVQWV